MSEVEKTHKMVADKTKKLVAEEKKQQKRLNKYTLLAEKGDEHAIEQVRIITNQIEKAKRKKERELEDL